MQSPLIATDAMILIIEAVQSWMRWPSVPQRTQPWCRAPFLSLTRASSSEARAEEEELEEADGAGSAWPMAAQVGWTVSRVTGRRPSQSSFVREKAQVSEGVAKCCERGVNGMAAHDAIKSPSSLDCARSDLDESTEIFKQHRSSIRGSNSWADNHG